MIKRLEQFAESLKAAPEGEFKSEKGEVIRVPKELRKESGPLVRGIMKKPEEGDLALEKKLQDTMDDIELLEGQERVVGKKIFEQSISPVLEEKKKQAKDLAQQIENQKEQLKGTTKKRKGEEVKTALVELAEEESKEMKKWSNVLPYLPDESLRDLFDFVWNGKTSMSKDKAGNFLVDAYLKGQSLPSDVQVQLEQIVYNIKEERRTGLSRLKDKKKKEKLLDQIDETPVSSEELKGKFKTENLAHKHDFQLFVLQQVVEEGEIAKEEMKAIIALSLTEMIREAKFFLFDWLTKQQPRLRRLEEKSYKRDFSEAEREEKEQLTKKEKIIEENDKEEKRKGRPYATSEKMYQSLGDLEKFKEVASRIAAIENGMKEDGENWRAKLAERFESAFRKDFDDFKSKAEKMTDDIRVLESEIKKLNADAENERSAFNSADLQDKKNIPAIDKLRGLKKEIKIKEEELEKKCLEAHNYVSWADISRDAFRDARNKRDMELLSLEGGAQRLEVGQGPLFAKANESKKKMIEQLAKKRQVSEAEEKQYFDRDFKGEVDYHQKGKEFNKVRDPVLKYIGQAMKVISDMYHRSSAVEVLNSFHLIIGKQQEELEGEERTLRNKMAQLTEEIEQLNSQGSDLKGRTLVWGKSKKLSEIDNRIKEAEKEIKTIEKEKKEKWDMRNICLDLKKRIETKE